MNSIVELNGRFTLNENESFSGVNITSETVIEGP